MKILRIGIIGAGRMGRLRAASADAHPRCEVVGDRRHRLPQAHCWPRSSAAWRPRIGRNCIQREDLDVVVVATPHKYSAAISAAALQGASMCFAKSPARAAAPKPKHAARFVRRTGRRGAAACCFERKVSGPAIRDGVHVAASPRRCAGAAFAGWRRNRQADVLDRAIRPRRAGRDTSRNGGHSGTSPEEANCWTRAST